MLTNAQRSTGPRTPAGKARIGTNAVTHGGYASLNAIERGYFREDPLDLQAIVDSYIDLLQPRNDVERQAAIRIAHRHVQLDRLRRFEAAQLTELLAPGSGGVPDDHVFDLMAEAKLYAEAAEILRQEDSAAYSTAEWDVLLHTAATEDLTLAATYSAIDPDDPDAFAELHETILSSIVNMHGGSIQEAADELDAKSAASRSALPSSADEYDAARRGLIRCWSNLLGVSSSATSRISSALDVEIRRFFQIRAISDAADTEDPPAA